MHRKSAPRVVPTISLLSCFVYLHTPVSTAYSLPLKPQCWNYDKPYYMPDDHHCSSSTWPKRLKQRDASFSIQKPSPSCREDSTLSERSVECQDHCCCIKPDDLVPVDERFRQCVLDATKRKKIGRKEGGVKAAHATPFP